MGKHKKWLPPCSFISRLIVSPINGAAATVAAHCALTCASFAPNKHKAQQIRVITWGGGTQLHRHTERHKARREREAVRLYFGAHQWPQTKNTLLQVEEASREAAAALELKSKRWTKR